MRGIRPTALNDGAVGALVTLDLPADSPVQNLPWIITIGPLHDEQEWEPVVCGPYERPHALALAGAVVADEDLMAVVEPLLPLADVEAIRDEIELAQGVLGPQSPDDADPYADDDDDDLDEQETRRVPSGVPPTEAEVRAGFARIAATLTAG
jgi:hypothetical protein